MNFKWIKRIQEKRNSLEGTMVRWALMMFLTIVISCIFAFVFMILISSVVYKGETIQPIAALSIIPVMGVFMGVEMYYITKGLYKQVLKLISGINQVSGGDFETEIIDEGPGVFCGVSLKEVFDNFNLMVSELRHSRIALENFMNNFSHEFKTPITSINGFAKLLQEAETEEAEKLQYLRIIDEESARLADLSQKTLLLSKVENQQIVLEKSDYELNEQIKQCVILLSRQWEAKKIQMQLDLKDVRYFGNGELLKQVWINVISNAIKFTPEAGTVTIILEEFGNIIEVQISDTGEGMDQETISHIFEKYYQGDSSRSTRGLGLGLSIVKRIVELCNGTIQVKSKKDLGSTFIVSLPKD